MENYIRVYDGVVSDVFCDKMIIQFEKTPNEYITREGRPTFHQINFHNLKEWQPFSKTLQIVFKKYIHIYEEECNIMDMDGNTYITVQIGEQRWMAENLRATLNNLGESIGYSCYNNNGSNCQDLGALYPWYAISDDICPEGWSVPTDNDWKIWEIYLGMSGGAANSVGWIGFTGRR